MWEREKSAYGLRFLSLLPAKWFPLKLTISPYGLGWKIPPGQPVPDSLPKPAGCPYYRASHTRPHQPGLHTVPLRSVPHSSSTAWKGTWRPRSTQRVLTPSSVPGLFYGTKPALCSKITTDSPRFPGPRGREFRQSPTSPVAPYALFLLSCLSTSRPLGDASLQSPVEKIASPLETG